jgi:hypothetical protein
MSEEVGAADAMLMQAPSMSALKETKEAVFMFGSWVRKARCVALAFNPRNKCSWRQCIPAPYVRLRVRRRSAE